jgi:hypothetical protein
MAYTFPSSQVASSYRRGMRKIIVSVTNDSQTLPYTININSVNPVTGLAPAFTGIYQVRNETTGQIGGEDVYAFTYSTSTGNVTVASVSSSALDNGDQIVIIGSND